MKQKIYPNDVLTQVQAIGNALKGIFSSGNSNLRSVAKFANMSVNSVKAVLAGSTANIASYALVAKALGTDLITVVTSLANSVDSSDQKEDTASSNSELLVQ